MMLRRRAVCLARRGVLLALAMALSYLEAMLPINLLVPLPGVKLGFANVAILAALYMRDVRGALGLAALRSLLGAAFGGGAAGFLFSLTGGVLSVIAMAAAMQAHFLSIYGVSLLGAAAHGVGQIAAAMALTGTVHMAAYLPCLLLTALVTGFATGSMTAGVLRAFASMDVKP